LHFRKQNQLDRLKRAAQLLARDTGPSDPNDAKELAEFVRAILAEIPPDYADALTARYLDDVSVAQMALDERSTETAIRSRLARARSSFRERYEQHMQPVAGKSAGGST
jgi:RNA polymerase sigma-70 factor (ECF subfamily)